MKAVCVSIGAALWGCFGCAGRATSASGSSSQTMGAQDSGLVDCLAQIGDAGTGKPYSSFASGSFSGGLSGELCTNGVLGYLERTSLSTTIPSQLLLILESNPYAPTGTELHFSKPSNAAGGELSVMLGGIGSPSPGTYPSSEACGSIALSASLSVTVDCAPPSGGCPPGCALEGPGLGPTCKPIVPEIAYEADAAKDCVFGGMTSPLGSWSLTLTAVDPYVSPDDSFGTDYYIVHGSLKATLLGGAADAAASTTDLELLF